MFADGDPPGWVLATGHAQHIDRALLDGVGADEVPGHLLFFEPIEVRESSHKNGLITLYNHRMNYF